MFRRAFAVSAFFVFISFLAGAQTVKVSGTVKDAGDKPLDVASVSVYNSNIGTYTDKDGHYTLDVPADTNLVTV